MLKPLTSFILAVTVTATMLVPQAYGFEAAGGMACGEVFRSTPHLEKLLEDTETLNEFSSFGYAPSETQLLRAARADALGLNGIVGRSGQWLRSWFSIFEAGKVKRDKVLIEVQRRRYKNALEKMGVTPARDPLMTIRKMRSYVSTALVVGLNIGVNYVTLKYLNNFVLIPFIPASSLFKPEMVSDQILSEMIEPAGTSATSAAYPATRRFVSDRLRQVFPQLTMTTIKAHTDTIVNAAGRYLNTYLLVLTMAHAMPVAKDLIAVDGDMNAYMGLQLSRVVDSMNSVAVQQNLKTLQIAKEKRARFLHEGQLDKVQKVDAIILNIENEIKRLQTTESQYEERK